jgi:hypothetical protein
MNLGQQQGHAGEHVGIGYVAQNSAQPSLDLFGRINTCTPTAIFTTHPAFTTQRETMDYVSTGTGVIVHDISNTLITLQVGSGVGRAVRQSREYLLYQPGKLQSCYITSVPQYAGTWDNSVVFRTGLFDDYRDKSSETNQPSMGHYFELSGNSWFVCERLNSTNNVLNVNRIPQANWNLDTLNGVRATSPSGFTLRSPPDRGALFIVDRQWLGVGVVRMGVIFNGKPIFVHVFHDRLLNRPYTHLPKLPIRWELEKVSGGVAATATAATVCASVQVLGEYTPLGATFTLPLTATIATQRLDTTERPLLILKLQQKYCRATFKILELNFFSDQKGAFCAYKNPTISGAAFSYTVHPDSRSMIEYKTFGTGTGTAPAYTISGGTPIRSGFFAQNATSLVSVSNDEIITNPSYCSDIAGNCDIYVITGYQLASNSDVIVQARWMEIV